MSHKDVVPLMTSLRVIAQRSSRAPATVSREVVRHGWRAQYRANHADQQAWESALRPNLCLLATYSKLRESLRVSYETSYRSLFIRARGALTGAGSASAIAAADPPLEPRVLHQPLLQRSARLHNLIETQVIRCDGLMHVVGGWIKRPSAHTCDGFECSQTTPDSPFTGALVA